MMNQSATVSYYAMKVSVNMLMIECMVEYIHTVVTPSEAPNCGDLEDPENGRVNTSTGTIVGSEAVYTCNEGYDLDGVEVRVCTSDGTWSDEEPTCVGKLNIFK